MTEYARKGGARVIEIVYHGEAAAAFGPDGQAGGFENADGNGEIHLYPLLDGVSAMCLRLEMGSYTEIRTQIGMLEINFCANGRFETRFSLRDHVLLKPGDMAISCYDGVHGTMSESHFPLGYYEGICLEVAPDPARRWIARNARTARARFFSGAMRPTWIATSVSSPAPQAARRPGSRRAGVRCAVSTALAS